MEDDALTPADVFVFPDEAKLARALLETAGIPVYLENEHTLSINWNLTNAIGGLRLMVPAKYLAQAREILDARVSEEELIREAEDSKPTDEDQP